MTEMQSKQVLFACTSFTEPGGIQRYNRALLHALQEKGYNIDLVVLCNETTEIKGPAATVFVACEKLSIWVRIKFVLTIIRKLLLNSYSFTICVHVHFVTLVGLLCLLKRKSYIVCTHGDEVWNHPGILRSFFICRAEKVL